MVIEKKIKSFIGFEWKKMILPFFLIIFFSYQIFIFYSISTIMENHLCDSMESLRNVKNLQEQNNTQELDQAVFEWTSGSEEFKKDMKKFIENKNIFRISQSINPFFPIPCELGAGNYCRYYIDKKSFDCIYNSNFKLSSLFEISKPEYRKISIFLLIFHMLAIFIIGYLISAIMFFIFRNIKIKRGFSPFISFTSDS